MEKLERKTLSLMVWLATVALLAMPAILAAQDANQQGEQQQQDQENQAQATGEAGKKPEQSAPASQTVPALPHVTGTVLRWNGYRIDLKTADGKTQEVAVNKDTERLVEIQPGAEVTVEYRRKIGDFVIAERVRPVAEAGTAAQSGTDTAPGTSPSTVTGTVVSWTDAALLLRTDSGDVTLFLSPRTEYLVKSLDPGLSVTVEYQETSKDSWLATRVRAAAKEGAAQNSKPRE